ncbi:small-conductance mechanosensitive channel [Flavobacterium arsenatis]|uniref:Small-conductance mechanosensitive channel n=2 Tax=Flavobacterium arsenatis TaxID=1484332 RepID=A0ABU1TRT0_9FLAO|nr:small-conductance mechanosensitive channel [Flavobacterium arsenatis]
MMSFINQYFVEIISTGILIILALILRVGSTKLVRKYAKTSEILEHRTNLIIKYISVFLTVMFFTSLFIIWGVETNDLFMTVSSVLTVIGVALFAQWSILSNITSGIILLFSFPFKIGDTIKIHDKDFPIEAEIEDINTFHTLLKTSDGEMITYPNTLLLQKGISIIKNNSFDDKEFTD